MLRVGQYSLIAVQLFGIVLSGLLILVTFTSRERVEEFVQAFAIAKVEAAADAAWIEAMGPVGEGGRADRLRALAERFGIEAEAVETRRAEIVPALVDYALSDRCGESCEFAGLTAGAVDATLLERAANLRIGQGTLQAFIVERYDSTVRGLITDLRQFGAVNMIALMLMLGLVVVRGYRSWRFSALAVAVTAYTAVAAYNYLYGQNWALALLFQDWAGPAYQLGMVFACCLFADWLFLQGFLTQMVVSAIASVLPG